MLATLVPMFDENMAVKGYSVFAQRENYLLDPIKSSSGRLDSAMRIEGLEIVEGLGLDTLSSDREVFIPISNVSVFNDIKAQCDAPPEKIVLLFDHSIKPNETYINRLHELREQGYRMAIRKIPLNEFGDYKPIIDQMDYMFLNHKRVSIEKAKKLFNAIYPNVKLCAVAVSTQDEFDELKKIGGFDLYEGEFFRVPVNGVDTETNPLKATYIELLRVVNDVDFDLTDAADVIEHDPALVIQLLKMVNNMTVNSGITSVRHAAAMLGQKELKRWINTAVTKELCADKPSEITRMSMIRARFAENLAAVFEMAGQSSELFLMGLFSVLDVILDKPLDEALESVKVSKQIQDALLKRKGPYAEVMAFIEEYENASWQEVSRIMLLQDLPMNDVYQGYLSALQWYRDLINL